jgi:hypothetical protein
MKPGGRDPKETSIFLAPMPMKPILLVVFAVLVLGACAYKSQPVYDVDKPFPAQSLSLDRIESLIMEAGSTLNWRFERAGAGHLKATQQQPKFAALVDIYFDQQHYKIVKNTTTGLNDRGSTIHTHYNTWIRNLENAIDGKLASASTRP